HTRDRPPFPTRRSSDLVVEAQSGAGGAIGAESVARAAPDGYTLMLTSASALVMNRFLSKSARLDPLKDFTPITKAFETVALVVRSEERRVGKECRARVR